MIFNVLKNISFFVCVSSIWLVETFSQTSTTRSGWASTVSGIVEDVCGLIWRLVKEDCIPFPSVEKHEATAKGFERKPHFPHCIGAVDGKHIWIIKPQHSGSMFFNYKDYFSTVLMAVADSDYQFTFVDIGSNSKDADPTILKNISFWKAIESGRLELPPPKPLPQSGKPDVPYALVGNEALDVPIWRETTLHEEKGFQL